MKVPGLKNILIGFLSMVVLFQAVWIITSLTGGSQTPSVEKVEVLHGRFGARVEFTAPIELGALDLQQVGIISPEVEGKWSLDSPDELRFVATEKLERNSVYELELSEALQIDGHRSFSFATSTFTVLDIDLEEGIGYTPGTAVIEGRIDFSTDVAPEDLVNHLTLTNETTGEDIPVHIMSSWSSRYLSIESDEIIKTPEGANYKLTVTRGLQPSDGEIELVKDSTGRIELVLDTKLHVESIGFGRSGGAATVSIDFSAPVLAEKGESFLTFTPAVDYTVATHGTDLVLSGEFLPGKTYELLIRQGLTAADGAILDEDEYHRVVIPDLAPSVRFTDQGMFMPKSRMAGLMIEAVNAEGVDVSMDRVYPNNLFTMLREHGWKIFDGEDDYYSGVPDAMGGRLYEDSIPLATERNEKMNLPLDLSGVVAEGEQGLFKINASLPGEYGTKRWVLVTDIGLVAKRDKDGFRVWAVSHASLAPLAGVKLTLLSDKNQNLGRAITDLNGAARLKLPEDHRDGSPYMILAEKGKDFSFLLPSRFGVDMAGLDVSGVAESESGLRAYIYGERDLYRPGEILRGMALVRDGKLAAPPNMPLILKRYDPRGREMSAVRIDSGKDGAASIELPIHAHSLTGMHSLVLSAGGENIGSYDFKVEEFIPDRIKVEVNTAAQSFAPGMAVSGTVQSNYLFGPPGSGLPLNIRAILRSAPFVAAGYEQYVFGDAENTFEPQEIYYHDTELGKQGEHAFSFDLPGSLRPPAALEAVILGRVSEQGGRGVTARKRVAVHSYERYVGLKQTDQVGYDAEKPIEFDFVVLDVDGKSASHSGFKARMYKDRYRSVVRKTPSGGYRYESVNDPQLVTETEIPAGNGEGSVRFTPPTYGSYSVVILGGAGESSARTSFYCGGWGYSPWALKNPARIELVPDKEQYNAGETATIQIRAPFRGRLLVAVESDSVRDTRIVDLSGNTGEVKFPVHSSYAPNAYVTAMLLRKGEGIGEGGVGRAFGAVPLLVDNLSNKANVSISAPAEVRPEAKLDIEVDADPGAIVTLAAVDEGILQLSGSDDPDPFTFYYARRALGVESFDTFAMLYPDFARLIGEAEAGGGLAMEAESQFMRTESIRRVKPVTFWSGPLRADANGKVRHTLSLPDFQGALRLVAVSSKGKRLGTGQAMVRVRSPLAVTPTLPRFLATGDTIEIPVTVRNDTGKAAEISVLVEASGAVTSDGQTITLELDNNGEQTVYLPVTASSGAGGAASIVVIAKGGGEMRRVVTELPVRPALPYKRELAFGSIDEQGGELVPAASGMVEGSVTRTVALGGLPVTRFTGKLEHLLRYPYGCAEQTTSKAFPLIRFGPLAETLAPHLVEKGGAGTKVQAALHRLGSMQTSDGGFAYWPGMEESHPWVSAYVTHFLLEAGDAGYEVAWILPRAMDYMVELGHSRFKLPVVTYALYNLARAGQADRGAMDALRDKRVKDMDAGSRMLLACSYGLVGDMESFSTLLGTLPDVPSGRAGEGGMQSQLQQQALMLMTLVDVDPADAMIAELAHKVSASMETNEWGTTLENGLAFAALGKALQKASPQPFSGELVFGEESLPFADAMQFSQGDLKGGSPLSLVLTSDDSTVYWSVATRGVPKGEAYKPEKRGIEVRRSFLSENGDAVDVSALEQGALVVMKTEIRSLSGNMQNVVLQALLPAGLEVENPRLGAMEMDFSRPEGEVLIDGYQDLRDDRVLFFTDIRSDGWQAGYTQLRAVTPGSYALPPVQAEAMYDPSVVASTEPGSMSVVRRQ